MDLKDSKRDLVDLTTEFNNAGKMYTAFLDAMNKINDKDGKVGGLDVLMGIAFIIKGHLAAERGIPEVLENLSNLMTLIKHDDEEEIESE